MENNTVEVVYETNKKSVHDIFIEKINIQKKKEEDSDIWKNSPYKHLVKLQSNNAGNVGESFMQQICITCEIDSQIDGCKTKKIGGGTGDGLILNKSVEIKLAHKGCSNDSFQHELGEIPWKAEYMIFIDVAPYCVYVTIFKNFNEDTYKCGAKCKPYFPNRKVTWRKGKGAFKLDTSLNINEENITKGFSFRFDNTTTSDEIKSFILSNIK